MARRSTAVIAERRDRWMGKKPDRKAHGYRKDE
jgi:hypothetical protein